MLIASFALEQRALRDIVQRHDVGPVSRPVLRRGSECQDGGFLGEFVVGDEVVARFVPGRQVQQDQRGTVLLLLAGAGLRVRAALARLRRFSGGGRRIGSLGAVHVRLLRGHVREPASLARDLVALDRPEVADPARPGLSVNDHGTDFRHREGVLREFLPLLSLALEGVDFRFRRRDRVDEVAGVRREGWPGSPDGQRGTVSRGRLQGERRVPLHGREDEGQPVAVGRQGRVVDRVPVQHVFVVEGFPLRDNGSGGADEQDEAGYEGRRGDCGARARGLHLFISGTGPLCGSRRPFHACG